jgi:hypothetical protein
MGDSEYTLADENVDSGAILGSADLTPAYDVAMSLSGPGF